ADTPRASRRARRDKPRRPRRRPSRRTHFPQEAVDLRTIETNPRRTRVRLEVVIATGAAAPVDRLDELPSPVHAQLEREQLGSAPVDEAVELRQDPETGEAALVERADEPHDALLPAHLRIHPAAPLRPPEDSRPDSGGEERRHNDDAPVSERRSHARAPGSGRR